MSEPSQPQEAQRPPSGPDGPPRASLHAIDPGRADERLREDWWLFVRNPGVPVPVAGVAAYAGCAEVFERA